MTLLSGDKIQCQLSALEGPYYGGLFNENVSEFFQDTGNCL